MKSSVTSVASIKPWYLKTKKQTIVESIAALFILLFLYTAISKTYDINRTVAVLNKTPFFESISRETAWAVVIAEYIISILLFFPSTRKAGLYSSFILMCGFTAYISLMMAFAPDLPCTCGGIISKMTWTQHLVFNILFTLLAFIAIRLHQQSRVKSKQDTETPNIIFT
jgi:putative oxidoreductase